MLKFISKAILALSLISTSLFSMEYNQKDVENKGLKVIESYKRLYIQSYTNFDFDKDLIKSINIKVHKSKFINNNIKEVLIEGHTDNVGSKEYNWKLGYKRANKIKDLLIHKGVDAEKIKVVSYGELKSIGEKNLKNRRVDITISYNF